MLSYLTNPRKTSLQSKSIRDASIYQEFFNLLDQLFRLTNPNKTRKLFSTV